jgi:hypothetical protein
MIDLFVSDKPQSLEVSKIRGKNKKNFDKFWSSIINKGDIDDQNFFLFLKLQVTSLINKKTTQPF